MQQAGVEPESYANERIMIFEYPARADAPPPPAWNGWVEITEAAAPQERTRGQVKADDLIVAKAEFEQRMAEEIRRSFEAGRESGRQVEREAQAAAMEAAEGERRRQTAELIESLAQERDRYLEAVEHEVVRLALAIAARILRREAQMDPLLLTGAVRVALGQLAGSTDVRLRVPPAELELWTEAIALLPHLTSRPTVVTGEGMRLGDCTIEASLGTLDLGIRTQLGEIERGFFDRAGTAKGEAVDLQGRAVNGKGEARP